jgi:hypothetical protein
MAGAAEGRVLGQNGVDMARQVELGAIQIDPPEIDKMKPCAAEIGVPQSRIGEVRIHDRRMAHVDVVEHGLLGLEAFEVRVGELRISEVGGVQLGEA